MIRRSKPLRRSSKPPRRKRKGKVAATRSRLNDTWSEIIRRSNGGRCRMHQRDHLECTNLIQAAHCFGKKALPAVRYELWNGWPLCHRHHYFYGRNAERWTFLLMEAWGPELYAERYLMAVSTPKHDYAAIAAELALALEQVA